MNSNIANPSLICAGFGKFDGRFEKFKEDFNKLGGVIREIKLFDVQFPVNYKYNEAVNFFKQNINPILKSYLLTNFPFRDMLFKQIENKAQLREFDYKEFDKHFIPSNKYPYGFLGLTPLFVDCKYLDKNRNVNFDDEEAENYKRLFSLKSDNYEPILTPTKEDEVFHYV